MRHLITYLVFSILPDGYVLSLHEPAAEQTSVDNSEIKNKAIVRGYMDRIVNQGRWENWERYFSEELTFNDSPVTQQQIKNMVDQMRRPIPDLRLTIEDQVAEADTVVTRITFHGIAPSGKKVEYMGIGIDRLAGGRVIEMWHLADDPLGNGER